MNIGVFRVGTWQESCLTRRHDLIKRQQASGVLLFHSKMHHRPTRISTQGVWAYMAVALVLQMTSGSPTQRTTPLLTHHLTKRSFFDLQCKGVYDKSIFARLDRICEDCYNLFRETNLHYSCRKNCFTTDYFKGCLEALQLTDEMEQVQTWIKQLHGAEPVV